MIDTYWVKMSLVSAPGCRSRFLLLETGISTHNGRKMVARTLFGASERGVPAGPHERDIPKTYISQTAGAETGRQHLQVFECVC